MNHHANLSPTAGRRTRLAPALIAGTLVLGALGSLSGCVALLAGGAVAGGLSLTDRRTSGTQLEDQAIELKAGGRIRDAIGDRGHINVTSYSRVALVTGEVPSEADKEAVGKAIGAIENVSTVVNELAISGNSSLTSRSSDTVITGKVKGALVDAKDIQANAIKVVTERGNVYLMGRVSEREADRAAAVARDVGGVLKVVRVFEILTEDQLKALTNK
jgi:osmotically-inducible protein OsmY